MLGFNYAILSHLGVGAMWSCCPIKEIKERNTYGENFVGTICASLI